MPDWVAPAVLGLIALCAAAAVRHFRIKAAEWRLRAHGVVLNSEIRGEPLEIKRSLQRRTNREVHRAESPMKSATMKRASWSARASSAATAREDREAAARAVAAAEDGARWAMWAAIIALAAMLIASWPFIDRLL